MGVTWIERRKSLLAFLLHSVLLLLFFSMLCAVLMQLSKSSVTEMHQELKPFFIVMVDCLCCQLQLFVRQLQFHHTPVSSAVRVSLIRKATEYLSLRITYASRARFTWRVEAKIFCIQLFPPYISVSIGRTQNGVSAAAHPPSAATTTINNKSSFQTLSLFSTPPLHQTPGRHHPYPFLPNKTTSVCRDIFHKSVDLCTEDRKGGKDYH